MGHERFKGLGSRVGGVGDGEDGDADRQSRAENGSNEGEFAPDHFPGFGGPEQPGGIVVLRARRGQGTPESPPGQHPEDHEEAQTSQQRRHR